MSVTPTLLPALATTKTNQRVREAEQFRLARQARSDRPERHQPTPKRTPALGLLRSTGQLLFLMLFVTLVVAGGAVTVLLETAGGRLP